MIYKQTFIYLAIVYRDMEKRQAEQLCNSPNMWGYEYTKRQAIKELMTRDIDDDTLRVIKINENKYIIAYTC